MEEFTGTWELESSCKFNDYMKAVGINKAKRMVAKQLESKVEVVISTEGNYLKIKTNAPLKTMTMEAKLNEKFMEQTPDGRVTETLFFMDGCTLMQEQEWDGKKSTIVRTINTDGKFEMIMNMDDVTCKKVFRPQAKLAIDHPRILD